MINGYTDQTSVLPGDSLAFHVSVSVRPSPGRSS
jgi:hypothetical protein